MVVVGVVVTTYNIRFLFRFLTGPGICVKLFCPERVHLLTVVAVGFGVVAGPGEDWYQTTK